jgi:hypothetical protein
MPILFMSYCLSLYACIIQTALKVFKDSLCHFQKEIQSGEIHYPIPLSSSHFALLLFTQNYSCHSLNLNISSGA